MSNLTNGKGIGSAALCLKPVAELLGEKFYIPAYQRGYRWTKRQILELLNDISDFRDEVGETGKHKFYCLQPVVVVPREDGSWELIDGQQRLTTVHLILTALKKQAAALEKSPYSIEYETRSGSKEFLESINSEQAADNIDYFHIHEAYQAIVDWFEGQDGGRKMSFLQCLLNTDEDGKNVKVIWYELPFGQEPVEVFVRLNMGKIPLTNSELIRGLFLRSRNFSKSEVTLKQLQIAQEWDNIEKAMQASDFWGFIYGGTDEYPARIEYLFELIAEGLNTENIQHDDSYGTFLAYSRYFDSKEDDKKEEPWRELKRYYMTCEEWFRDRTLYHLVGYLITRKMSVLDLKKLSDRKGKREFQITLKNEIFSQLFDSFPQDYEDKEGLQTVIRESLSELSYDRSNHYVSIRSVLLLFNIVTLLQNSKSAMRFPFDNFKGESWDLEHIKSVKSEMPARRDDQKTWIQTVIKFWEEGGDDSIDIDEKRSAVTMQMHSYLNSGSMSLEKATELFEEIYTSVLDFYDESKVTEVDNGIQNLTLLDAGTNRSYKNAVFPVKRNHIRKLDKTATFVPICTTNVFLKYYSRNVDRMLFWTESDRQDYFTAIVDALTNFFADGLGDDR